MIALISLAMSPAAKAVPACAKGGTAAGDELVESLRVRVIEEEQSPT
jgi:hypothetical protein